MKERPTGTADAPQRTCVGCRTVRPAAEMVRCTASGPSVERSAPGRGAWVCSVECFAAARKRNAFARAWKQQVGPSGLDALQIAFEAVITKMRESPAVTKG